MGKTSRGLFVWSSYRKGTTIKKKTAVISAQSHNHGKSKRVRIKPRVKRI